MPSSRTDVTDLLIQWNQGDAAALERLIPLVSDELHKIARGYFQDEPAGHLLQPTAVVNECYLRLVDRRRVNWKDRSHFFAFAARTMRRILVDEARARRAGKRGGGMPTLPLDEAMALAASSDLNVLVLEDALEALAALDERQSRIVELRFYGGLSIRQTAEVLGLAVATVNRDWASARAWLRVRLDGG